MTSLLLNEDMHILARRKLEEHELSADFNSRYAFVIGFHTCLHGITEQCRLQIEALKKVDGMKDA